MEIPKWDVWFELHDWEYHRRVNPQHFEWLMKDHNKPIYAFEENYCGSKSLKFPLQQLMGMFGNCFNGLPQFKYWTNSPSYMMGLAILQGATTIGLWGIDMAMQDEYAFQRPSCELMIGVCLAKGINVIIPSESSLCKSRRMYGYETHNDDGYVEVRTREQTLKQRLGIATQESAKANHIRNMLMGGLQEVGVMQSQAEKYNAEERIKVLQENLQQQENVFQELERQKCIFQGALEDLSWVKTVFLT
jgi:hypothetical protein